MNIEQLQKLIDYCPETGVTRWKERGDWVVSDGLQSEGARVKFNKKYAGSPCLTTIDKDGYLSGHVLGGFFRAHRVAYAIHYGRWPINTIDHKNRDRADNRIENIVDATRSEQQANRNKQTNNTSGFPGIHYERATGKWVARVTVDGRRVFVGKFGSRMDALAAKRNFVVD
jgi:hypothetical protein